MGAVPTSQLDEAKREVRRALLARRKGMAGLVRRLRSRLVCRRVGELSVWRRARAVFAYAAWGAEPDLAPLLRSALRAGRPVAFPVTRGARLEFRRVRSLGDLAPGSLGILEPAVGRGTRVTPGPGDLVLVPGVGFTASGDRLGRGGGHYDRALARRSGAAAVGVGFDLQIVPGLPCGARDVRMDAVVTESRTHWCGTVRRQSLRSSTSMPPTKN